MLGSFINNEIFHLVNKKLCVIVKLVLTEESFHLDT